MLPEKHKMTATRKTHALLVARVIVSISLGAAVVSTMCVVGQNLTVAFPEINPPSTPSGQQYSKLLVPSEVDNLTIPLMFSYNTVSQRFPPNEYFRIQYNSTVKGYYISMIKAIDREGSSPAVDDAVNSMQYRLTCSSPNASIVTNYLTIQITDVNDNSPVFTGIPYTSNISELINPGTVIHTITSTDLDNGSNKQVVYSLSTSPGARFDGAKHFNISAFGQGSVTVTTYLDFESMYLATNYQSSLVYFNVTITARDQGSPARSSSTVLIITVFDVDDQGPEFSYTSCITSSEKQKPSFCVRPKYRSSISSSNDQVTTLQLTPDPTDASNPATPINMIMQDKDTLNSPVICNVSDTIPAGYYQWFQTRSNRVDQSKQYRCEVIYVPDADTSDESLLLPEIELIIRAMETEFYNRSEYASILVTIAHSNSSYCPAEYSTDTTDSGVVICTARPEKDTSLAIGLGIALGLAILIIIILIVVGIIVLKRWKPSKDKTVHNYSTVDITQQDRHDYLGLNGNSTGPGTPGDQQTYSNVTDKPSSPPYQSPIYDEFTDGSIIRRTVPEEVVYANATLDV